MRKEIKIFKFEAINILFMGQTLKWSQTVHLEPVTTKLLYTDLLTMMTGYVGLGTFCIDLRFLMQKLS